MIFHWMAKNNRKCVCGGADAGKEWLVVMDKVIRHVTKCYKEKKRDTALNRKRACVCTKKKKNYANLLLGIYASEGQHLLIRKISAQKNPNYPIAIYMYHNSIPGEWNPKGSLLSFSSFN